MAHTKRRGSGIGATMRGINHITLVGHAGADPEVRTTPQGETLTKLRLATNRGVQRDGVWVQETDWHDVDLWGKQAETAARYVRKGEVVGIEGSLRVDTWTDKEGQRRKKVFVRASRLHLMGRPKPAIVDVGAGDAAPAGAAAPADASIPF
jgi:single-strand DNA-binding protein